MLQCSEWTGREYHIVRLSHSFYILVDFAPLLNDPKRRDAVMSALFHDIEHFIEKYLRGHSLLDPTLPIEAKWSVVRTEDDKWKLIVCIFLIDQAARIDANDVAAWAIAHWKRSGFHYLDHPFAELAPRELWRDSLIGPIDDGRFVGESRNKGIFADVTHLIQFKWLAVCRL